ncbi:MAG: cryptochrome/photolyase family protein [Acidobacteriota bacterium]
MKLTAALVYPHQLFRDHPAIAAADRVYLIEEPLLFTQFALHKQKLVLHRASMKFYEGFLKEKKVEVRYVEMAEIVETQALGDILSRDNVTDVIYADPVDDWLEKRLVSGLTEYNIKYARLDSPMFINSWQEIDDYFVGRGSFSMARFYSRERERRRILMEPDGKPVGGKFSFDTENRKKLPKNLHLPKIAHPLRNTFVDEAIEYVEKHFGENCGDAQNFAYPTNFTEAELWLDEFLKTRLANFGAYEDAIAKEECFVFHSVLTPMLNIGLLTPKQVIDKTLAFAKKNDVPLNSLEGFVRQVIGWREFMRGVYVAIGGRQRTSNFWQHKRKLPKSFWTATTGIEPVDNVIGKVLNNAYSHHIERLMIIGNFMVLTETDPDDAYRWFMEMYIDAYDWVMVPNVYGMSLQSDGGTITTKPYISGSNYIRKMSDFPTGEWCNIWDGLYWRFIAKHEKFFLNNPRLSMMPKMLAKMDAGRQEKLMNTAEIYLKNFS